ncbi:MAG: ComF family protein [Betaproteobacteria bacterium]
MGMAYQVPLDGLLMLGKFANDPNACQALGRWLGIRMPGNAFFGISDGPPLVVPIPSTPSKLRLRGYNPVEQIARGWVQIAKRYGHPAPRLECKLLLRHDHGPSQSRRSAKDRALAPQASASGSGSGSGSDLELEHSAQTAGFYLNPSVLAAHSQLSHVLLLDDVMTTGSTLAAACLSLRAAAIQSISVAVLMRR